MNLKLAVQNAAGETLSTASGSDEATLFYEPEYCEGDILCVESDTPCAFVILNLDDALPPAFVYLRDGRCAYPIPFGEKRVACSPRAFTGGRHYMSVRAARPEEIGARKNLAFNPYATHEPGGPFPFASANVETRGESVFAAKNAIDGVKASHNHGAWPFSSWGINRDPQAALRIDFGRTVAIDEAVLYLRADFPHDAWWERATLHFSDGSRELLALTKTPAGQRFSFPERKTEYIVLDELIKADDPSPFPALTQIELYGREA